jgi:hypothetical protein
MLLLVSFAFAGSSATSFATDPGDWSGGTLGNGVLTVVDDEVTLDLGVLTSFTFTARMRLAEGDAFTVSVDDTCAFAAEYTGAAALRLGASTQPFGLPELAFSAAAAPAVSPGTLPAEAAGVGDPDVVSFNGAWWMFYTATDLGGATSVRAATSPDLQTWTAVDDLQLDGGAEPAALVTDDGTLVVYYAVAGSIYRTSSSDGVDFAFPNVALSPGPGFDASGLGHPSVTVDADGAWHLWYGVPATGATGAAASADGLSFTRVAELNADASRLAGLDVDATDLGFEGIYTMIDSVGFADGGDDGTFSDAASDLRPVLAMNETAWSEGGFGTASLVHDGDARVGFVDAVHDGTRVIGRVDSAPEPGTWGSLVLTWDGTTLGATWNDGPELTCAVTDPGPFVVRANGTVELDETRLDYTMDAADTADTAGTPTDSGPGDSGDEEDTGDDALDSADTGAMSFNAGEWLGEPGGCGCQSTSPAPRPTQALSALGFLLLLRAAFVRPARSA